MEKRAIAATLAVLFLAAVAMPSLAYAASDEQPIGVNADVGSVAPTVTNVYVSAAAWDPWSYDNILVEVQENNTLATVSWVRITVFENDVTYNTADANRSHYTFTYTTSGGTWHENGPDSGGQTHINAAACVAGSSSSTWDNYTFNIRLAKTSNPTVAWTIVAEAHDGGTEDNVTFANKFTVNQYISQTLGSSSVSWTGINPGDTDVACGTFPAATTVIANDTWSLQLKMENATWISGANNFAVSNGKFYSANTIGSAVTFTTAYQNLYTSQTYTAETGASKDLYFWLSIPGGQASGNYTNNIWVKVTN
jgi:hypothetical protein